MHAFIREGNKFIAKNSITTNMQFRFQIDTYRHKTREKGCGHRESVVSAKYTHTHRQSRCNNMHTRSHCMSTYLTISIGDLISIYIDTEAASALSSIRLVATRKLFLLLPSLSIQVFMLDFKKLKSFSLSNNFKEASGRNYKFVRAARSAKKMQKNSEIRNGVAIERDETRLALDMIRFFSQL